MRRAIFVVAAGLAACAPKPMTVAMHDARPSPSARHADRAPTSCRLKITDVADLRPDPATIGTVAGRSIHGPPDSDAWIKNILSGLDDRGIAVTFPQTGETATPAGLTASAHLKTVWATSVGTARTASMVLSMEYRIDGVAVKQRSYRGAVSDVSWWGTEGEVQSMLDSCVNTILQDIDDDVGVLCRDSRLVGALPTQDRQ